VLNFLRDHPLTRVGDPHPYQSRETYTYTQSVADANKVVGLLSVHVTEQICADLRYCYGYNEPTKPRLTVYAVKPDKSLAGGAAITLDNFTEADRMMLLRQYMSRLVRGISTESPEFITAVVQGAVEESKRIETERKVAQAQYQAQQAEMHRQAAAVASQSLANTVMNMVTHQHEAAAAAAAAAASSSSSAAAAASDRDVSVRRRTSSPGGYRPPSAHSSPIRSLTSDGKSGMESPVTWLFPGGMPPSPSKLTLPTTASVAAAEAEVERLTATLNAIAPDAIAEVEQQLARSRPEGTAKRRLFQEHRAAAALQTTSSIASRPLSATGDDSDSDDDRVRPAKRQKRAPSPKRVPMAVVDAAPPAEVVGVFVPPSRSSPSKAVQQQHPTASPKRLVQPVPASSPPKAVQPVPVSIAAPIAVRPATGVSLIESFRAQRALIMARQK
jgi:hypothetical protein